MSRSIEKTVRINAPVNVVWRALTEAEELKRWFPIDARVKPGPEGAIWLSWGDAMEAESPITAWEPNRRLQTTQTRGPVKLALDFHLETKGGRTVVRLVHSGFGDGPEWDDEFHMTDGGWTYFMAHLRLYLERHRGTARDVIVFREALPVSRNEALRRLIGPSGLSIDNALATATAGTPFTTTTAAGQTISGSVIAASHQSGQFGLTIAELNDAVLFFEMEPHETGVRAALWLSTYALPPSRLEEVRRQFADLYQRALEVPFALK